MNFLSQKIKDQRKSKGLTQTELAVMAKVNLRTIQRIENAESEPRGKTLHLVCEALEIELNDLNLQETSSHIKRIF